MCCLHWKFLSGCPKSTRPFWSLHTTTLTSSSPFEILHKEPSKPQTQQLTMMYSMALLCLVRQNLFHVQVLVQAVLAGAWSLLDASVGTLS